MHISVLVSGNGSNLQAIIDAVAQGQLSNIVIANVIADRNCYAIERALDAEIPVYYAERGPEMSQEIDAICQETGVELIVLAGFLSILSEEFCQKWERKIINMHPSLLPAYGGMGMYGRKVHEAVLQNHETQSGVSIHYVTPEVDAGEIILQQAFPIDQNTTIDQLAQKVSDVEKPLLIQALHQLSQT
ncbi:MAG: phosphoribosylglycinamide formyltransferase [Weeksellaceae bacterium]|nr:phosphoribosylglycinamide formyltransferase [Weeksellaceae bacterium]